MWTSFLSVIITTATIRLSVLTVRLSLLRNLLCSVVCSGSHHSWSLSDCVLWHLSTASWQHICLCYIWRWLSLTFSPIPLLKFLPFRASEFWVQTFLLHTYEHTKAVMLKLISAFWVEMSKSYKRGVSTPCKVVFRQWFNVMLSHQGHWTRPEEERFHPMGCYQLQVTNRCI